VLIDRGRVTAEGSIEALIPAIAPREDLGSRRERLFDELDKTPIPELERSS
jgi:hypothetical protein